MPDYDTEGKEIIADDIVEYLTKNYKVREADISVSMQRKPGGGEHEAYISVKVPPELEDEDPMWTGWDTEQIREMTSIRVKPLSIQGSTVYVKPDR